MEAKWACLPAWPLVDIAQLVGSVVGMAETQTVLRLVCKGWRLALPLGHFQVPVKIWGWEPRMDQALGLHARSIEVLTPLPLASSPPLPQLACCRRLASLTLQHVRADALPALGSLMGLQSLDATVYFPDAAPTWLDWVPGLHSLRELRLTAALTRLQPEEGLTALLPLRPGLTALRFDGCLLLTDAGGAVLARLGGLMWLEVTGCSMSQAGLDAMATSLPQLAHLELRLRDGTAGHKLLSQACAGSGSLVAHVTRGRAAALLAGAGATMPRVTRLAVRNIDAGFLLAAPPAFHLLHQLESLSLPGIQLPAAAVEQLAACAGLQELEVALSFTVRDEALLSWRSLTRLRRLRLGGNLSLSEQAVAAVLASMPRMQELRLEQVQGGGALLAPLAAMPALRALELAGCHLGDSQGLGASLCSAPSLTHLAVQSCGIQSEVCGALAAALRQQPNLRELRLGLRRAPPAATGKPQLTALDIHTASYAQDQPAVPAWRRLAALTDLRRLHACTGLGWDGDAFAAVAAAATALRAVTVTDNAGTVDGPWVAALAPLRQISRLELNSCRQLGEEAVPLLCRLSALTSLEAFRCPKLNTEASLEQLRPRLALLSMQG